MKRAVSITSTVLLTSAVTLAQQYVISTVAGGAPPLTPTSALSASIGVPQGIVVDVAGNVYFLSIDCLFKIDTGGTLTRIAGNSRGGYSGDNGPALNAQLNFTGNSSGNREFAGPIGLSIDGSGNLYVADANNGLVRRVANGTITTVAGGGSAQGDGGQATKAHLAPGGVVIDSAGSLYISEPVLNRVRKVTPSGIIATIAGTGTAGYSGDGGTAVTAQLMQPEGIALDAAGNLYIADYGNHRIRKVSPIGIITTVAGNGGSLTVNIGDGGPATNAQVPYPNAVASDPGGVLYIASGGAVRKVTTNGNIATVVPEGGLNSIALDSSGNIYLAEGYNLYRIRKVRTDGTVVTIAGSGFFSYSGDGGPATLAQLDTPIAIASDQSGNVYLADYSNNRVRKLLPSGVITTIAGTGPCCVGETGDGGAAVSATIIGPRGIAADASGNIYITGSGVRKLSPSGIITKVAGNGTYGYSGDGGPAANAAFSSPTGIAVDAGGNIYVADSGNARVRKISQAGIVTTVAGGGGGQRCSGSLVGLGGPATQASLCEPTSVAVDEGGNFYISDSGTLKVDSNGIITSVIDVNLKSSVYSYGVTVDNSGNLYVSSGTTVQKVSPSGVVVTIAGAGNSPGYSGDGGPATSAQIALPSGVAVAPNGNIYVSDEYWSAIRLLQPGPPLAITAIANAASNAPGSVSPGEIVVLAGFDLGPAQLVQCSVTSQGNLGTQCAGTTVSFNGKLAPIIYTWATQVAAIVPYSVSGAIAQATVTYQGQTTAALSVNIATVAPGLFTLDSTGKGQAAAVNQDGSINTAGHPAPVGSYISLFATGEGQTSPAGVDGQPAQVPLPRPLTSVTVTIGGVTVTPQYAGGAPGEVAGLMQINVQIPSGLQTGNAIPVTVQIGSASTQAGVTIAIQ